VIKFIKSGSITPISISHLLNLISNDKYWVIQNDKMIVEKYGNYVRTFMWQLCGWDRVDICMTYNKRAFDFFYTIAR
jgi:hypothetical protein